MVLILEEEGPANEGAASPDPTDGGECSNGQRPSGATAVASSVISVSKVGL